MSNKKSTKRALLSSVLSLVLCLTMLVGTTFAWFTDSVTSTNNIIKSGKLDVELNYANKYEDVVAENWSSVTAAEEAIFNYDKWEPGYVDVKYVQVANKGNLALKYIMHIIPEVEIPAGVTNLADVIDVYILTNPQEALEREDLATMKKVGTLSDLMTDADGAAYGIILPATGSQNVQLAPEDAAIAVTGNVTMAIALKMQESAGNEYQDLAVGENGFKIQLLATQYTWENDSFDNQYDAGLTPLEGDETMVEKEGIQYVYTDDGEAILYLVTEDFVGDTVNVPEGITSIGRYSFYYNQNIDKIVLPSTVTTLDDRAFRGTSASEIVLNEGLETIGYQAFRDAKNVTSVEIPSTVTTIGKEAFQLSGIKSVTIPATVATVEVGAFRDCATLETITVEGNTVISNYFARNCANLTTVNLNGDAVTFTGTSMSFSNAESGKADKITIFVKNDTVANAVKAANGSCTGYKVVIPTTTSSTSEFKNAISEGGYVVIDGEVAIDTIGSYDFSIGGYAGISSEATISGGTITRETASDAPLYVSTTEPVKFEDVTFKSVKGSAVLATRTDGANITLDDCTFDNESAPSTGNTGIQVYAQNVTMTFNNCTFNNMPIVTNSSYPEGIKLVFNDCTFTWTGANCPAMVQLANYVVADIDFNDCKYVYDAPLTSTRTNDFVSTGTSTGAGTTIDFNNFEMVGTAMDGKIWSIVSKGGVASGTNVTVTATGNLKYTFNGTEVDFNTYLFR